MSRRENQTTGCPGLCSSLSCEDYLFRDSLEPPEGFFEIDRQSKRSILFPTSGRLEQIRGQVNTNGLDCLSEFGSDSRRPKKSEYPSIR